MKRILLASASIVAFAGAASAELTFTGSADLGYNDDVENGFFSDIDITAGFFAELDNGVTAAASLDLEDLATSENGESYELSLTSANAGLFYGDTAFAAENLWVAAGEMNEDHFSAADGEEAIRAEVRYGNFDAQVSYVLGNNESTRNVADTADQLSVGVSGEFGNYTVVVAYQADSDEAAGFFTSDDGAATNPTGSNGDFQEEEVFGISVTTTISNVDIIVAYAEDLTNDEDSTGIQVSYPFGPVTATAYYVAESTGDDSWGLDVAYSEGPLAVTLDYDNEDGDSSWGLEGSYEVSDDLVVYAGIDDNENDYYIGAEYDLGGGADLLVSFAEDENSPGNDEIGAQDFNDGTTVELSFEF